MSANWGVIVIFPIYGQFGVVQKMNSGRIFYKMYIFINKNWKQNLKSLTQLLHYCFD